MVLLADVILPTPSREAHSASGAQVVATVPTEHQAHHHRAKLTPADVLAIRTRWQNGEALQRELAREYRVSTVAVSKVCRGVTWKGVPMPDVPKRPTRTSREVKMLQAIRQLRRQAARAARAARR